MARSPQNNKKPQLERLPTVILDRYFVSWLAHSPPTLSNFAKTPHSLPPKTEGGLRTEPEQPGSLSGWRDCRGTRPCPGGNICGSRTARAPLPQSTRHTQNGPHDSLHLRGAVQSSDSTGPLPHSEERLAPIPLHSRFSRRQKDSQRKRQSKGQGSHTENIPQRERSIPELQVC